VHRPRHGAAAAAGGQKERGLKTSFGTLTLKARRNITGEDLV
jgi:hypothetical protein